MIGKCEELILLRIPGNQRGQAGGILHGWRDWRSGISGFGDEGSHGCPDGFRKPDEGI